MAKDLVKINYISTKLLQHYTTFLPQSVNLIRCIKTFVTAQKNLVLQYIYSSVIIIYVQVILFMLYN